jgi:hypothetical protein
MSQELATTNLEFNPMSRIYVFASSVVAPPRLLHLIHWHASTTERAGLWNYCPQWSCTERGWIRILGCILRDYPIAYPSLSSWLIYLFVGRALTIVTYNTSSSRLSDIFATPLSSKKRKYHTFSSLIMSYMLNLFIYIGMILLDCCNT